MTNRSTNRRSSRGSAASRAEARRRARLAAQGDQELVDADPEPDGAPTTRGSGFLQRLFPVAPPLKGKGDPLAGFTYTGRLRGLVSALYLLRRNPIAWLLPGAIWLVAAQLEVNEAMLFVAQIAQFAALAAAGWFGWQRPWLFGFVAALIANLPTTILLLARFSSDPASVVPAGNPVPDLSAVLVYLGEQMIFAVAIGAALGWYGGYLRRRLGTPPPTATAGARRR